MIRLEKETATHSSVPARRIPRKEEPGGLQSTGSGSKESDVTERLHFHFHPSAEKTFSSCVCY